MAGVKKTDGEHGRVDETLTAAELKARQEFFRRTKQLRSQKPLTPGSYPAEEMLREDRER
ncbi:MAG TPA: hypothetical protein VF753_19320 [Terriglobales bacterium]